MALRPALQLALLDREADRPGRSSPRPPGRRNGLPGSVIERARLHQPGARRVWRRAARAGARSCTPPPCRTRGTRRSRSRPSRTWRGSAVLLHPRVLLPARVGRVLQDRARDRPLDRPVLPALGGEQHDVRGPRDAVAEHERVPAEAVREHVGLDRELRRREDREDVRLRRPSASRSASRRPTTSPRTAARRRPSSPSGRARA